MVSEADNLYLMGWNDCLQWVVDDLEKEVEPCEENGN